MLNLKHQIFIGLLFSFMMIIDESVKLNFLQESIQSDELSWDTYHPFCSSKIFSNSDPYIIHIY